MMSFSWMLSPQDFAEYLFDMKRLWRKRGGTDLRKSRRRISDLVRKRIARYRKHGKSGSLPKTCRRSPPVWTEPDPGEINVVIFPRTGELPASANQARREAKRILRKAFASEDGARIEMIMSRNADASRRKPPALATARIGKNMVSRAILLESIGAAICPPLTDVEKDTLRASGASVLDNELLSLDDVSGSAPARLSDAWHLDHIGASKLHRAGVSGKGVAIGIVDTGIEPSHPEFAGKKIYYQAFSSTGRRLKSKRPKDYGEHGTQVAALCAGKKIGVAPGAQLAVAAIFSRTAGGELRASRAQILNGLNWLARGDEKLPRPADVINVSWGREVETEGLYDVIQSHLDRGILTVAAIGNGGAQGADRHRCPGNFDIVMGVGAVNRAGTASNFSAWGKVSDVTPVVWKPDIMAPGETVVCAKPKGTSSRNCYASDNGTSFASPIVTGSAALLMEITPTLKGDVKALRARLLALTVNSANSTKAGTNSRRAAGTLDLSRI